MIMQIKKLIQSLEAFAVVPMIAVSMPFGGVPGNNVVSPVPQIVLSQKQNIEASGLFAFNQVMDQKAQTLKLQADAIDAYFESHDMPLAGTGMKMAVEAQKNDLDYRILPAIAARESTGGRHACKNADHSFFGWGSCKINFDSDDQAIEIVALNLGGNNPTTAHHYDNKTTWEILRKYNSYIKRYPEQVMKIMDTIGPADLGEPDQKADA